MAKIYPERPAASVIKDPKRSGELKVFNALKSLPDPYIVFYSAQWQNQSRNYGESIEGEADFIIGHPEKGIIFLEVKGGGIIYDAEREQWYSQDRGGILHEIKDPVDQARRNHYELERKLIVLPGWPKRDINFWHAVCFPDVFLHPQQYFKADLPREQILDRNDLEDIINSIDNLFNFTFSKKIPQNAPGQRAISLVEGLLANSFTIHSPLNIDLESEDKKLIELTERQYIALSILGDRKRAAIAGCAGSGKTMLAAKKVQQLCDLELNVLLVCYNTPLADYLKPRLIDATVTTFHSLCQQAITQLRYRIPRNENQTKLFEEFFPQTLLDYAEQMGPSYDAIIVDEGQDFLETYWIALESLLKPDGYFYIFYDDNQNLFHGSIKFGGIITEPPFQLVENCRNTKKIHQIVKKYHNNPDRLLSFAPDGRDPVIITYSNESDLLTQLRKLLHALINEEQIGSESVVILTPHGPEKTILKSGTKLGNFTLSNRPENKDNSVFVTSIQRFKGLERRVVIIAELDDTVRYDLNILLYVGCSRARTHLIILHDETLKIDSNQIPTKPNT